MFGSNLPWTAQAFSNIMLQMRGIRLSPGAAMHSESSTQIIAVDVSVLPLAFVPTLSSFYANADACCGVDSKATPFRARCLHSRSGASSKQNTSKRFSAVCECLPRGPR